MPRSYNPQRDVVAGRTASQIESAKRKAVGGSRKRCRKGKSCSATCIASYKVCLVDIPWVAAQGLGPLRDKIQSASLSKKASDSLASLTERWQDSPSLEKEKKDFNNVLVAYRRQVRAGNLNEEGKERIRDLLEARRGALKREESDPNIKRRKKELDDEGPVFDKLNSRIKAAERLTRMEDEYVAIQQRKLEGVTKGSEREKALQENIRKSNEFKRLLEADIKKAEKEKEDLRNPPKQVTNLSSQSSAAISNLRQVIEDVNNSGQTVKVKGTEFAGNVNWQAATESGARRLGRPGAYGAFIAVPQENLFRFGIKGDFPDGVGIKGGRIGKEEAALIKKAGEANLGPKLVAAKMGSELEPNRNIHSSGLIAMGIVPGKDARNFTSPSDTVNGVTISSAFWKARADLHRLGIAHQDMHPGNVIIDDKGKVRFVDFGLASSNLRSVLAEAIGGATNSDFQINRWRVWGTQSGNASPEFKRLEANWERVKTEMKRDGFSDNNIRTFAVTGIRQDPNDGLKFGDAWGNPALTDSNMRKYIGMLYEGL